MAVLKFFDPLEELWKPLTIVNNGITFTPEIVNGILSWTNNGALPNPDPVVLGESGVVMKDMSIDFPPVGNESVIYIERSTSIIYRWDKGSQTYIKLLSPSGGEGQGGGSISGPDFVNPDMDFGNLGWI